MAFRSANLAAHMIKFNSSASAEFLELYNGIIEEEIQQKTAEPKHQTFAPSQMRCDRVSWFRLRGTQPDKITSPDARLKFTAEIGTACHEMIQNKLINKLGSDWIDVDEWVSQNRQIFQNYDMDIHKNGLESQIDMRKPFPVRFACDGIVRFNGKVYLLEIKSAEFSSLNDLIEPKPKHIDQVKAYSMLLQIPDVLFLYIDRQYGELKCFELNVADYEQEWVKEKMQNVLDLVEANIAPEGLPVGDPDCTQNMCPYWKKCKEWGR